ncbi:MAG: hypothetical protein MRJ65_00910 [Candidatus Brocadiaceae bacterium]|nr:hypothetical protein [Candidatus Brocadiaceae bacterium]
MSPFRFKVVFMVFLLFFLCIVVRLFQLQIIESDKYRGISKTRRIHTYPLEAVRGSIFDRNGTVLAVDQHAFDLSVKYKNLLYSYIVHRKKEISRISELEIHKKTKEACIECHKEEDVWLENVSEALSIPKKDLLDNSEQVIMKVERLKRIVERRNGRSILVKEETDFHPVVFDVSLEKIISVDVKKEDFPGVRVNPRPKRIYPQQRLASHILGYMGKLTDEEWKMHSDRWNDFILNASLSDMSEDSSSLLYDGYAKDDCVGRFGVELYYEEELRGLRGKRFEEITCVNTEIKKVVLERPPLQGNNLYLTIDSQIQACSEEALGKHLGAIIVMDTWTGEILSMASNPDFNPNTINNDFQELSTLSSKPFLNRAIQGALPPGSIFKIITAISALSDQSIDTRSSFVCQGFTNYKNIIFRCWSQYGHGLITLQDAIPYSCNVFFFETAKSLKQENFYLWSKKFGIGEKTGIDIPYEKEGNMPKLKTTAMTMNVAIGQGALLTTPLQCVRIYAALANGGTLVYPHVLLKFTDSRGGTIQAFRPENKNKVVLSPAVLDIIRNSLQDVVIRGTAKNMGLEVYKVAGKTGTAETGKKGVNHAWFAGYVPYDKPRYSFVILIEHTSGHGGEVAGPIARKLMTALFPEIEQSS